MGENLKTFLSQKYGLEIKSIKKHGGGFQNEIYFVLTKDDSFTLRLYKADQKNQRDLDFQFDVLNFLHERKLPVQVPKYSLHGEKSLRYSKDKIVQVLSYIAGKTAFPIVPARIEESGRVLGRFHKAGSAFPWEQCPAQFIKKRTWSYKYYIAKISLAQKSKRTIPLEFQRKAHVQEVILSLLTAQKNFGRLFRGASGFKNWALIHGDYHPGNLIFENNRLVGIFDFDQCGYGPLLWDVGFALAHFGFNLHHVPHEEIRANFLRGYLKEYSLLEFSEVSLKTAASFTMAERLAASVVYFAEYPSKNFWVDEVSYYHHKLSELLI